MTISLGMGNSLPSHPSWIALAIALMSLRATNLPHFPSSNISLGPLGQSVATIGMPSDAACNKTFGSPSYIEDNTNSFVSDRGGKWVDNYNSIIYNYPKKINDMILSIENLNDTKLLSIHEIDLSKFPEKFNKNMDLVDLL